MNDTFYITVTFKADEEQSAIIAALLMENGFEGAEETGEEMIVSIPGSLFDEAATKDIFSLFGIPYQITRVAQQNWNEAWEGSFEPVRVGNFVSVRAAFHNADKTVQHEIIITPKMSFGTGHHATTFLMMEEMQHLNFNNKKVVDFGTGTGVLAILAEKLGASNILAIDNDDWSITNAIENIDANECTKVKIVKDEVMSSTFNADIILANINLNIIISNLATLKKHLAGDGVVLLSGLLVSDKDRISNELLRQGLVIVKIVEKDNWIVVSAHL
jgi:ribosomal protein L11 methyltransferase